jgi:hypothetical protein
MKKKGGVKEKSVSPPSHPEPIEIEIAIEIEKM